MSDTARISLELPRAVAEAIRVRVESGAFPDASSVVREGVELLEERDRPLDPDRRAQLASGYDVWLADPSAVHTLDEVAQRLRQRLRNE